MQEEANKSEVVKPKKKKCGGRQKGTKNKLTTTVKKTVLETFEYLQKDQRYNMKKFAREHPVEFYRIAAKLIPTEITAEVTGANGEPLYKIYQGIDIDIIMGKKQVLNAPVKTLPSKSEE